MRHDHAATPASGRVTAMRVHIVSAITVGPTYVQQTVAWLPHRKRFKFSSTTSFGGETEDEAIDVMFQEFDRFADSVSERARQGNLNPLEFARWPESSRRARPLEHASDRIVVILDTLLLPDEEPVGLVRRAEVFRLDECQSEWSRPLLAWPAEPFMIVADDVHGVVRSFREQSSNFFSHRELAREAQAGQRRMAVN